MAGVEKRSLNDMFVELVPKRRAMGPIFVLLSCQRSCYGQSQVVIKEP